MRILLMAPPVTGELGLDSPFAEGFDFPRAVRVSAELPDLYRRLAEAYGCAFLDTTRIVKVSPADGVHLSPEDQTALGRAVFEKLLSQGLPGAE